MYDPDDGRKQVFDPSVYQMTSRLQTRYDQNSLSTKAVFHNPLHLL